MIRFLVAFPNFGEVNIIIKDTAGFVCIVLGNWENRLLHFLGRLFEPFFFSSFIHLREEAKASVGRPT